MPQQWEPGTQYDYDSVVIYEGVAYKIIQPHRSQGDWAPPNTPALWGRMQDQSCAGGGGGGHHHHHEGQHQWGEQQQQQQQQQQPQQQQYQYGGQGGQGGQGGAAPQAQATDQEKQTNWYDLTDERKKQLELGGGLLAGAGLLAGGFAAFQGHKKGQEEQKAQAWALSNWLQDAQARAQAFRKDGPRGPYTWVLTNGKNFPQGAIEGGREKDGKVLYISRAYWEGGVHIGKAGKHLGKGAVIGYAGKEVELDTYEILLGDTQRVRWVTKSDNDFSPQAAVEGGREADGTPLLIAQAYYKGGTHPGKYSDKLAGACIAYGNSEEVIKQDYRILILNPQK